MDIKSSLYVRAKVSRFGIGPLTSMYWYSETKKPEAIDWRPEVHKSDGLEMWSGKGERLWRPLNNPPRSSCRRFRTTIRAASASCSVTGYSTTISTAFITTGARASGSSRCQGRAARAGARDRSSFAKSRPMTRSTTMWSRCGCRPSRWRPEPNSSSTTALLGRQSALSERPCDHRRDAPRARRPARPAAPQGGAQVHGRVARRAAR